MLHREPGVNAPIPPHTILHTWYLRTSTRRKHYFRRFERKAQRTVKATTTVNNKKMERMPQSSIGEIFLHILVSIALLKHATWDMQHGKEFPKWEILLECWFCCSARSSIALPLLLTVQYSSRGNQHVERGVDQIHGSENREHLPTTWRRAHARTSIGYFCSLPERAGVDVQRHTHACMCRNT